MLIQLRMWMLERELTSARRVNIVFMAMVLALLAAVLMGSTGCATIGRALGGKSDETIEFEHALAAAKGAPYEGTNATLVALFAGFSANDAKVLEAHGLGGLAEVLDVCRGVPTEIRLWPSPVGLQIAVRRSCSHEIPGIGFGPGMSFTERERRMIINDLQFSEDPDAGLSREALAERYRDMFTYTDDGAIGPYIAREFRMQFALLLAMDQVADHKLTVTIERHNGERSVGFKLTYKSSVIGYQLDRGLGAFGTMVERYAGNRNGVVTPWEVQKFVADTPYYLAIAYDRVAPSDFDLVAKQGGIRIHDVPRFRRAVASLRDMVGEDAVIAH